MTKSLTELLAEIKSRAENATPGPMVHLRHMGVIQSIQDDIKGLRPHVFVQDKNLREEDAEFITHARTDVPKLLAVIEKLIGQRNEGGIAGDAYTDGELAALDTELAKILDGEK